MDRKQFPDTTVIGVNRQKAIMLLAGSLGGLAMGIWALSLDEAGVAAAHLGDARFLRIVAIVSVTFFGANVVLAIKKLFDKRAGLVLHSAGIEDNSTGISSGLIPWSDVAGTSFAQARKQKLLVVRLVEPRKYLDSGGRLKRALYAENYKSCGSPIVISPANLDIAFHELVSLFNRYQEKYIRPQPDSR